MVRPKIHSFYDATVTLMETILLVGHMLIQRETMQLKDFFLHKSFKPELTCLC